MGRKTISMSEEAYERLQSLKSDDQSWTDFGHWAADALEAQDDVNTEPNAVPDDILTEDNIPDLLNQFERRVERQLESAMRR